MRAFYRITIPEEQVQTEAMSRGSDIHARLEKYWDNKELAFNGLKPGTKEYKFVRNFFNMFEGKLSSNDIIEQRFSIQYLPDVKLVGRMDRIHEDEIYDWKTNSNVPRNIDKDPQFIIYHYVFSVLYNRPPKAVYFVSLEKCKKIQFNYRKEHADMLHDSVIPKILYSFKHKSFTRSFKQCEYCPFKAACFEDVRSGL
jgi:hypothetical protein